MPADWWGMSADMGTRTGLVPTEWEAEGYSDSPGGFEGFGSLLEQPLASGLPVLDREHKRASRDHLDPLAPPDVGGVRDHDFGANLREAVMLNLDVLKDRQNSFQKVSSSLRPR